VVDTVHCVIPPSVRQWRDCGRFLSTGAGKIFLRSDEGDGPTILLLHGYPPSLFDCRGVTPHLSGRAWLTLDFPGGHRCHRRAHGTDRTHDMGTSVTNELLTRDLHERLPFELQRAVITNGSVILERASPRPIQKILRGPLGPLVARFANRRMFTRGFVRLFSDDHPLSAGEAEAQWSLMSCHDGARIAHLLIFLA
jgi:hypothetical protein